MKYLYSFLLGVPFSVMFFLAITFLNDNQVIFLISVVLCVALIRAIANPILKKLSGAEKYETSVSVLFILGLTIPLFLALISFDF
ncbi:hypothetical protein [Salinicoccus albus]|uniref:hypothetical protein n=1 Tax=Salinicoccus albus TaxID=418756 RepID=UPI000375F9BD|nr:hypothetical protein [Salinicoccus albus]